MNKVITCLISSKARRRVLVRLFANPDTKSYLRQLAREFNLSTNAVREELNKLSSQKLLISEKCGKRVYYKANKTHPIFPEITSIIYKTLGLDKLISKIFMRLDNLNSAYVIDDYAEGKDSGIIDIVLVGKIDPSQLNIFVSETELIIDRKIRSMVLNKKEFIYLTKELKSRPHIMLWDNN